MAGFVACALLGYFLYSPAPLRGRYDPSYTGSMSKITWPQKYWPPFRPRRGSLPNPHSSPILPCAPTSIITPGAESGSDNIDYFVFSRQIRTLSTE